MADDTIHITVNGETRTVAPNATVRDLVQQLGLADAAVAVEVNRDVVPRRLHGETELSDGDVLEVVTLVGGG